MKSIWAGVLVAVTVASSQAAPNITGFVNGDLIGSNLTAGTTCAVEWASTAAGPWTNSWANLEAIPVGTSGTIRVGVPFFYRLQDAIQVTTTTSTSSTLGIVTTTTTSTTTIPSGPSLSPGDVAVIRMSADLDTFTVLALRDLDAAQVLHWTDNGWQTNNTFRTGEASGTNDVLAATVSAGTTFEVNATGFAATGDQIFLFGGTLILPTLLFGVDWANTQGWDADATSTTTSADPAVTGGGLSDVHTVSVGSADNWEYAGIRSGNAAALLAAISDNTQWVAADSATWTNGNFDVLDFGTTTLDTTTTTTDTSTTSTSSSSTTTAPPSANNLAFVGFNVDPNDNLALVALTDVPAGTTLYLTDNEWNGQSVGGGGAFNTGEGVKTWNTGGAQLNAGTVVAFANLSVTSLTSVTVGTITGSSMDLNASTEGIFLYEGTTSTNPTALLAAIGNNANEASTFGSLAGSGLVTNLTAVVIPGDEDIAVYNGARTGQTGVGYLPLIGNAANWISEDGANDQSTNGVSPDLPFDLTPFAQ